MAKEKEAKPQQDKQVQAKPAKASRKEAAAKQAAAPAGGPEQKGPPPRLAVLYREKVVPDLMQKFGYKTVMQVPRIRKITLNMGVGETTADRKILDNAVADMAR